MDHTHTKALVIVRAGWAVLERAANDAQAGAIIPVKERFLTAGVGHVLSRSNSSYLVRGSCSTDDRYHALVPIWSFQTIFSCATWVMQLSTNSLYSLSLSLSLSLPRLSLL